MPLISPVTALKLYKKLLGNVSDAISTGQNHEGENDLPEEAHWGENKRSAPDHSRKTSSHHLNITLILSSVEVVAAHGGTKKV